MQALFNDKAVNVTTAYYLAAMCVSTSTVLPSLVEACPIAFSELTGHEADMSLNEGCSKQAQVPLLK